MMEFAMVLSIAVGVPMVFIYGVPPVAKALARRIDGGTRGDDTAAELAALRQELDQLRAIEPRMVELEERVDFAERLLAQQSEPNRLGGGGASGE